VLAGLIGNVMEWYDFALYGYFVLPIGNNFFPSADPRTSLISAFGAFAAGFLVRPIGGVLLGRIADRVGRTRALMLSVVGMAMSTFLMAFLPTYDQVGLLAPICLILLRIMQGLSAGGEYTTSIVFLAEHAPQKHRGIVSIWGLWGSVLGMLMGSAAGFVLSSHLTQLQLSSWGWRIPFGMGILVALVGVLLRQNLQKEQLPEATLTPLKDTFTSHRGAVLRVLLLNIASSVGFYTAFVYAVTYVQTVGQQSETFALALNTQVMSQLLIFYPISAWISDRIGRRPILIAGSALLCLISLPTFHLLQSDSSELIHRGEMLMMITVALLAGAKTPANVELMPVAVRCTGLALAFNIAEGYFGGTTPLIASWLVEASGHTLMPAAWLIISGSITLVTAIWFTPETFRLKMNISLK
jgi:MHS family proline/betaine transporter-like MFS transporter